MIIGLEQRMGRCVYNTKYVLIRLSNIGQYAVHRHIKI